MALIFMDGFAHYPSADVLAKWTGQSNGFIQGGGGRFGGNSWRFNNNDHYLFKNFTANYGTLIAGMAHRVSSLAANIGIFTFWDYPAGVGQVQLVIDSATGLLKVYRITGNSTGTLLGTASHAPIVANSWHYYEMKVAFHGSTGTVDVQLDGVNVLSLTGQNTRQSANNYANRLLIGGAANAQSLTGGSGFTFDYSDLYLCDNSGSLNNSFLGDVRIQTLYPTGAGNYTQFTPSTGSNWQNVDDATENGDTDYNASATLNQIDSFATSDLATGTLAPKAVQQVLVARKDDAGLRAVAPLMRISSADYLGTALSLGVSYQTAFQLYETNPATSAAWAASEVNGLELGYKVTT